MEQHPPMTMAEFETHCRANLPQTWDTDQMDNYLSGSLNAEGLKRHMVRVNADYNIVKDVIQFQLEHNLENLTEFMDEVTPNIAEVFISISHYIDDLELNLREFQEYRRVDLPDVWAV